MRRLRPLAPYAVLLLFALIAAEPLAREPLRTVCSDDGAFHLFRAVELGALIGAGHLFPRWAPHMAQGYGFPFFDFYAPLSSYAVVGLHTFGLAYPAALKLAFALTLWASGGAAFLFVRTTWGERAGIAAGVAYLFAPYLAYDVLFRANFAETFAFVWPPLVLWGLRKAVIGDLMPGRLITGHWLLITVPYAALILTHNIFALIASPLFAAYGALLVWRRRSWRAAGLGASALALGIGLAAYFWLPALAERGLVHSDRLLVPPIFTWYTNFITPGELLAAPPAEDPLLLNPSPARALGLVTVLLSLPALALAGHAMIRKRSTPDSARPARGFDSLGGGSWELGLFALALLGYAVMTQPASEPIWRLLQPLELVQFPWRMLGPAALCAAVLVGASVYYCERLLPSRLTVGPAVLAVTLLVLGNLGWWYPRYCRAPATATVADLVENERATGTIGTTAKGEYLPLTADYVPEDAALAEAITRGEEPSRLQVAEGEAEIVIVDARDPLDARFTVAAGDPVALIYRQFAYPGWQVFVDDAPVESHPTPGAGLIGFSLPPGSHAVRVVFGSTPLRTAANLISLGSLVALAAFGVTRSRPSNPQTRAVGHSTSRGSGLRVRDLGVLAVALIALKLGVIDRVSNPLRQSAFDGQSVSRAQTPLRADFQGGLGLYGYDLSTRVMPADGGVDAALYVSMREPALRTFWPAFRVQDAAGLLWNDINFALPPRWHREPPFTYEWPPEQYAQWARRLTVLPGTPPGEYTLSGEVFDHDTFQIASVLDEQGNAVAPRFSLGTLTVTRPLQPFSVEPETAAPHAFGPLTFLGYRLSTRALKSGDTLTLTWYWRSDSAIHEDYLARLSLIGPDGRPASAVDLEPANGYATSLWRPGDEWRGQHPVVIPADLPGGEYQVRVSADGLPGAQALGSIHVEAPQRVFELPAFDQASGAQWVDVGELAGYSLRREGKTLTVTLVWKAAATPALSYAAFVHLGDASRVWAQSDSVPAGGGRPTTGWLRGEYVVDAHTLTMPDDLPSGRYEVFVGLYDPLTSTRVPAAGPGAGADNRVQVTTVALP